MTGITLEHSGKRHPLACRPVGVVLVVCAAASHEGVEMRSLLGAAEQTCPITPTASASLSERLSLQQWISWNLLSAAA